MSEESKFSSPTEEVPTVQMKGDLQPIWLLYRLNRKKKILKCSKKCVLTLSEGENFDTSLEQNQGSQILDLLHGMRKIPW